jgi:hypothetical protein
VKGAGDTAALWSPDSRWNEPNRTVMTVMVRGNKRYGFGVTWRVREFMCVCCSSPENSTVSHGVTVHARDNSMLHEVKRKEYPQ